MLFSLISEVQLQQTPPPTSNSFLICPFNGSFLQFSAILQATAAFSHYEQTVKNSLITFRTLDSVNSKWRQMAP